MVIRLRRPAAPPEPTAQQLKERAEARFKMKEQQAIDRPLAMQEYRAAQQAVRDRTARLRTERLAREARGWVKPKLEKEKRPGTPHGDRSGRE